LLRQHRRQRTEGAAAICCAACCASAGSGCFELNTRSMAACARPLPVPIAMPAQMRLSRQPAYAHRQQASLFYYRHKPGGVAVKTFRAARRFYEQLQGRRPPAVVEVSRLRTAGRRTLCHHAAQAGQHAAAAAALLGWRGRRCTARHITRSEPAMAANPRSNAL